MKTTSSKKWLTEHMNDPFVKQAQKEGFRARSAYKLKEIQEKDNLIKPGMIVVDLGSTPGAWCQMASIFMKKQGKIFAIDILPMDLLPGVEFIQGDFREQNVFDELVTKMAGKKADVVLSDLSPNLSGIRSMDQPRTLYLCEIALDFARLSLKPGGSFLVKIFQGEGFIEYLKEMRQSFDKVTTRKPEASRDRSNECYLLGKGFKVSNAIT
jgi:23S rRNA (uridine2552-2'-O)-methyltransferase